MGAQMRSDPDDPQKKGVQVDGKMVLKVASNALKSVLTNLAPKVLPLSELVRRTPPRESKEEGLRGGERGLPLPLSSCTQLGLGPLYKFFDTC